MLREYQGTVLRRNLWSSLMHVTFSLLRVVGWVRKPLRAPCLALAWNNRQYDMRRPQIVVEDVLQRRL